MCFRSLPPATHGHLLQGVSLLSPFSLSVCVFFLVSRLSRVRRRRAVAVVRSQPRLIISPCLSSPVLHWKLVVCSCCRCASVMCLSRTAASRVGVVCGVEYAPLCARVCHAVNNRFPVVLCCDSCGVLPVFASCVSSAGVSPCMSPCVSLCDVSSLYLSVFLHENSHFAQLCVSPLCLSVCVASVVDFPILLIPAPN